MKNWKIVSNSFHKLLYNPQRTEGFSEESGQWRQAEPAVRVSWAALGHQQVLSARQCRWRERHRDQATLGHLHQICKFSWRLSFTLEPLSRGLEWNYYSFILITSIFLKIHQFSKKKYSFLSKSSWLIMHYCIYSFIKLTWDVFG